MSRLDYCHLQIVHALEKDRWKVNPIPLEIETPERTIHVDIEASRHVKGTQQRVLMAEVKCFPDRKKTTRELYEAVGQYIIYRAVLAEINTNVPLYLALPVEVYTTVFDSTARRAVRDNMIKLPIVNLELERIVEWIE
ncbi:MAG: hypothetical protein HZC41_07100 [Chloroflexi bacterium]|nr:hypothetical protein [Chloroflexota bacterium]